MPKTPRLVPVMYRACPICDCEQDRLMVIPVEKPMPPHNEAVSMPIVECASCGMVYADLAESTAESTYEQYERMLELYIRLATKVQYWAYDAFIKRLGPPRSGQRLMDFGAGIGSLMLIAQEHGWDAHGVDPAAHTAWARDQLGLKVFVGNLDASPYPEDFFDAIVTLSTLEHIWRLKHELTEIFNRLRPGGVLLVGGVPNHASFGNLVATRFTKNWSSFLYLNSPPAHINFLTPRTMKKVLGEIGFSRIKVDTYGIKRVSAAPIQRSKRRPLSKRGTGRQAPLSHPFMDASAFKRNLSLRDRMLKAMISVYASARLPFWGDKLLVIAHK